MPSLSGPINRDGALVTVEVGLGRRAAQRLRGQKLAVPTPLQRIALLDTGAERTAVDSALALQLRNLGAEVVTVQPVNAPGLAGNIPVPPALPGWTTIAAVLSIRLMLLHPQGQHLDLRELLVDDLPIGYYAVLIGSDVLDQCDFSYFGRRRTFELTY